MDAQDAQDNQDQSLQHETQTPAMVSGEGKDHTEWSSPGRQPGFPGSRQGGGST